MSKIIKISSIIITVCVTGCIILTVLIKKKINSANLHWVRKLEKEGSLEIFKDKFDELEKQEESLIPKDYLKLKKTRATPN